MMSRSGRIAIKSLLSLVILVGRGYYEREPLPGRRAVPQLTIRLHSHVDAPFEPAESARIALVLVDVTVLFKATVIRLLAADSTTEEAFTSCN